MSNNVAKMSELIVSFYKAVNSPENLDESGNIIWNWVDADIHIDAGLAHKEIPEEWFSLFDDLADEFNKLQEVA
jgi:hypothetical protein